MIKNVIEYKLIEIFSVIDNPIDVVQFETYKNLKSKLSAKVIAQKLGISESMLFDFEVALKQYFQFRDDNEKSRISCFRISLWIETICKNLNLSFSIDESISNEEIAIKQVRALELLIRDLVNENLGGNENVLLKLQELFNQDVIQKWLKGADETGILSGTSFSELSNIFLDKNIFKSVEELVENSQLKLSKNSRDSIRYILEDIRLIRNSIAHNKKVSNIQIEALNEYYRAIASVIKESKSNKINPDAYLDLDKADMEVFISNLKQDNMIILNNVEDIKTNVIEIKKETSHIRKKTYLILGGIALLVLLTTLILFLLSKQSNSTNNISKDIKDVKDMVSGDAELKNMSSTEDLTSTKDLNARTKDINAVRLAIVYFDNSGGESSMNMLKKGLADMLITDLSNVNMLDIIERDKLETILKEQKLSNSKEFDPNTAAKVGKLLGAQVILTGGYFDMMGSLRIDARFIDVETGKILKSDGVDGKTSSFFKIQKQLSWKIIKNLDTKLTEQEKNQLTYNENSKPISIEDLNSYSIALDSYDRGNKSEAKKIAEKLKIKYPDFEPLKNFLKKL